MRKKRAIHVSETTSSVETSLNRTGISEEKRVVTHFSPNFVVHMTNPTTAADIDLLAEQNVPVVCCPRANCRLADGFPPIMTLYRKGIRIALGTDNLIVNAPDMFEEMEFLSKALRGIERNAAILRPVEILKMATINGAQALGLQNELGSIEKGKLANLLFIDFNTPRLRPVRDPISTIVHRVRSSDLKAVMVEGEIVSGHLT
jgi:5-methylthioadenosine/S-adenosylhomocysteine deaminase